MALAHWKQTEEEIPMPEGLKPVRSNDLPALFRGYDQVWHW